MEQGSAWLFLMGSLLKAVKAQTSHAHARWVFPLHALAHGSCVKVDIYGGSLLHVAFIGSCCDRDAVFIRITVTFWIEPFSPHYDCSELVLCARCCASAVGILGIFSHLTMVDSYYMCPTAD